jgi:hypothetical protein
MVMQIEQTFGITISYREAETIRSVGDLYALVLDKVGRSRAQVCVTSAIFYRLRRALRELLGVPRQSVRTATRLEDLIPVQDRQRLWQQLRARLGISLPSLRRPNRLTKALDVAFVVSLILPLYCAFALHVLGYPAVLCWAIFGFGVVRGILTTWAGYRLTLPWADRFPPACVTVRDLVFALATRSPTPLVSDEAQPGGAETWALLCSIVGEEFDVPPGTLTATSRPL